MAGNEIYLGAMIDGLNTKLDTVMGKIDAQILAIEDQLQSLIDIGKNTSQTVTSINSKAADIVKKSSFNAVKNGTISANASLTALSVLGSIKNTYAKGFVRIKATNVTVKSHNGSGSGHKAYVAARVGATVYNITPAALYNAGDTVLSGSVDIPVAVGDVIEICVKAESSASGFSWAVATLPIDSITINYDLINIVTESAFTDL